jgi:hypothetical protein
MSCDGGLRIFLWFDVLSPKSAGIDREYPIQSKLQEAY